MRDPINQERSISSLLFQKKWNSDVLMRSKVYTTPSDDLRYGVRVMNFENAYSSRPFFPPSIPRQPGLPTRSDPARSTSTSCDLVEWSLAECERAPHFLNTEIVTTVWLRDDRSLFTVRAVAL